MMNHLVSHYDLKLVSISVVIAILAAYTALTFARHVTQTRTEDRQLWLSGGAIAMGTGIWAMHFVGMLAFQLPVAVTYNFPIVLLSMLAAVLASAIALKTVTAPQLPIGAWLLSSIVMGSGISTMHYTGMAALQVPALIHYNWNLVSLSIGVAIVVSMIALKLVFRLCQADRTSLQKLGATIVMGAAIPLMHYIGMAAVHFSNPTNRMPIATGSNLDFLSNLVCLVTLIVLGGGLLISLEVQVRDRTASLSQSNQQLTQLIANLKQTQSMLAQSDKMSSIGEMVAGIAHEIKNPTSVLVGNLDYVKNYSQDLAELLTLCVGSNNLPVAIQTHLDQIEADFLLEDYPKVVQSIAVGVERVHEIVMTLRRFSCLENSEATMLPVDLRQSIESTLLLLRHRLKISQIEVVQDYGKVPDVECLPGQINQVLLNIIGNAIDALETHDQTRSPQEILAAPSIIAIRTDCTDETAIIYITDNGAGMTEAVSQHIFEAFYTTKSAAQGTGLGLSISHQIITDRHYGQLICTSAPGQGCEFQIHLPLQQTPRVCDQPVHNLRAAVV
jgi:NO-binding membrane sensor protein with MHYT domain/nitrogen-specific signal transduction histidine kinase